ncbi:MAG: 3-dehydroquinate synthase, partial [Methyloligellaceae bacterium]
TVHVALGRRSYDIKIGPGLLANAEHLIAESAANARCAVVTDETVAELYLDALKSNLESKGLFLGSAVLTPGETTKSFTVLTDLCETLLSLGVERGDAVVAFGGGVIGDLAGFAASVLRRGVRLVQIPTTLLAQVDSSVGGKTGINSPQGKNLIGTFHQPNLVIADTDILDTLSKREFRAGYAELFKYGLIRDEAFVSWLEENWTGLFANDAPTRIRAIEICARAKAEIVAEDEHEHGLRALLNLGHTFGHALEAWAGYSGRLLHGEAVAIGMMLAFELSEELGICPEGEAERVAAHLRAVGLPTRISDIEAAEGPDPSTLWNHMVQDKKVVHGQLAFILVHGIGSAFVSRDVSDEIVQDFLHRKCRR